MKASELDFEQLLEVLEKDGRRPMVCDTPVPFYDNKVKCGSPTGVGDIVREVKMVPHATMSMLQEFFVLAGGDSMEGVSIEDGDILRVKAQPTANDGDVVVALFNGDSTIKTYCEDEQGRPWLVPQNPKYKAFPMSDAEDACIVGVVIEVIKQRPRVKYRDCMALIHKAQEARNMGEEITEEQVSRAIKAVAPMVELGRQWYAVCRVLEDVKMVPEGDFEGFCQRVRAEVPEHPHLPARDEMVRMAVQSFKKPVSMWTENDAPVSGNRFRDYLNIALTMGELLSNPKN